MRIHKHNRKLCSVSGLVNTIRKSNKSQLNYISSWPLLFLGTFLILFILGLSPLQFFIKIIKANYTKTETIQLYAHEVIQDNEPLSYDEGWWNLDLAKMSPQLDAGSKLTDFNDQNASFYTGGNYNLSFSSFRFLKENVGEFKNQIEQAQEEIMEEQVVIPQEENIADNPESTDPSIETLPDENEETTDIEIINEDDIASSSEESGQEDISFGNYFGQLFNTSPANAEEMLVTEVGALSDLGVFRSAKIRLSMAMSEVAKHEEAQGNESGISEEMAPAQEVQAENSLDNIGVPLENNAQTNEENIPAENTPVETGETEEVEVIESDTNQEEVELLDIPEENIEAVEISEEEDNAPIENEVSDSPEEISLFDFVKKANAQVESTGDAKLVIWYAFASSTMMTEDPQLVWHMLDSVGGEKAENALNGDYFTYDAPFLADWTDIDNLKIKIDAKETENSYIAYLDSVWVEAEYEPSEIVQKINKRKEWEKALRLLSAKIDFRMDEKGTMRFHYQKNRENLLETVGQFFGIDSYWEDVSIRAVLVNHRGQEIDMPLAMIFEEGGDFAVNLPETPRGFKPGKYSMRFYVEDSSDGEAETIFIDQDFNWGVLALNVNKSIYTAEDDSAFLQMAVLDERGRTLCDADLSLNIISPNGDSMELSTANGLIIRNEDCGPDNVIDTPDYYATYMLDFVGEYAMTLNATTTNGAYSISDRFEVAENVAFEVERVAPTRIYPLANYDMTINIKANQDFSGDIYDYVPSGFEIATQTIMIQRFGTDDLVAYENTATGSKNFEFAEISEGVEKELGFKNIDLFAGDVLQLNYEFDAPDISPEFYLLGHLEMADFKEARYWQIASDLIAISSSTNGSNISWTNPAFAWDNGVNTYANRTIPRKTGGGEPANYIQSTVNTTMNLGGDIKTVEIGIEGYVGNTAVSAYLIPYFNGTSAGTQYSILGTTMGTTDNNTTKYVNITNSAGAPSVWTWADIQNLDIRIFGGNTANSADYPFYIDQIMIRVDYDPNTPPNAAFVNASQRKDNSGIVDLSIEVSDIDLDNSRAKIDYVSGASCDFTTPLDPTLDETDANATSSSSVDPKIFNAETYQVGTTTGWINTSEGTNRVSFDWLSASNTPNAEGIYCLRVTANDLDSNDTSPATTSLMVDNKAPTQPGNISSASATKNSVTLYYGSPSSDLNFLEYRIYYGTDSTIDETDNLHGTTSDPNLDDISFGGKSSTTVSGLLENKTYYFAVWAYDEYGNKSSSSVFSFTTNKTPDAVFNAANPAQQRTDGSGMVDISIDVGDLNNDPAMAKIEYVEGACEFTFPSRPLLDENPANISSSFGLTSIENDNDYQIGNSSGWIVTPATNTIAFDWQAVNDLPDADGTYCLRLTANDQKDDQSVPATVTLELDNVNPSVPGNLAFNSVSTSTITLNFGNASADTNFKHYKMYYKIGTAGVTEADTLHNDANLNNISFNGQSSTKITGLIPNTDYVINIWAYDDYGNISVAAEEITVKTNATVNNDSLTLLNPISANWLIADGSSVYTFRAIVSEDNGWNNLNNIILRLADSQDSSSPFNDIEFTWNQTSNSFTETGTDTNNAVSLSPSSSASCGGLACTINFNLIFNADFSLSSTNYSGELYSTNDGSFNDHDIYADIYHAKIIRVEQVHYRWRNDDGGE